VPQTKREACPDAGREKTDMLELAETIADLKKKIERLGNYL